MATISKFLPSNIVQIERSGLGTCLFWNNIPNIIGDFGSEYAYTTPSNATDESNYLRIRNLGLFFSDDTILNSITFRIQRSYEENVDTEYYFAFGINADDNPAGLFKIVIIDESGGTLSIFQDTYNVSLANNTKLLDGLNDDTLYFWIKGHDDYIDFRLYGIEITVDYTGTLLTTPANGIEGYPSHSHNGRTAIFVPTNTVQTIDIPQCKEVSHSAFSYLTSRLNSQRFYTGDSA